MYVPSAKHEVNIALAGPLNCGKSAMTVRYLTRRYIGEYDPSIGAISDCELKTFSLSCAPSTEDTYSKMITVDGDNVLMRIMDTSDKVNE